MRHTDRCERCPHEDICDKNKCLLKRDKNGMNYFDYKRMMEESDGQRGMRKIHGVWKRG